jgi:GMP synthase (glutamine-hydrolysing)
MTTCTHPCRGCRKSGETSTGGRGQRNRRILVLQHAEWEVAAGYEELLAAAGWTTVVCRHDLGEALPDRGSFDGIVAMGGPMSVNDHATLPWLRTEQRMIAAAVRAGVPFFGVCLGAQILAAAFGARVYPGPTAEFGMGRVRMTEASFDDPLFGGVPRELSVFQWHGETFGLPAGAVLLAAGDDVPNQALRIGPNAYGVQFHMEISTGLLARWLAVDSCRQEIVTALGPTGPQALAAELSGAQVRMLRLAARVFGGWMRLMDSGPRRSRATARHGSQPVGTR